MNIKTIFVLLLLLIVALFSVQNAAAITVRFLTWEFSLSLALVILLAAFCGLLAGLVVGTLRGFLRSDRPEKSPPKSH